MEKNGATIASINNDMEATQKQNTQPKKEHFFRGSQIMHTLWAITCHNAKVLPYGKFEGVRSDYKVEIETQ